MTAVEGNASVYQVIPVSRITGKWRAEFLRIMSNSRRIRCNTARNSVVYSGPAMVPGVVPSPPRV